MITEKDLKNIGFVRVDVTSEESGDGAYHYYLWEPYENCRLSIISSCNDEIESDKWNVYLFDDFENKIVFGNVDDVKIFIDVIKRNIVK